MLYHPDKNPDCKDCQQKMTDITRAYNILSSAEQKEAYDKNSQILKSFKTKAVLLN